MPKNSWDQAAKEYSSLVDSPDNMCYRALIDPYLKEFFSQLSSGKILDLGCGDGYLSRLLSGSFFITGIDSSEELIKISEARKSAGHYSVGDITQEIKADHDFDVAISNMVLMSVADISGVYKNACHCLKADGLFIITILHPIFSRPTMRWFKTWPMKILRRDPFARIDGYGKSYEKMFPIMGLKNATPLVHRPISDYLQPAIDVGFKLKRIDELYPTSEMARIFHQPEFLSKYPMVMAIVWQK